MSGIKEWIPWALVGIWRSRSRLIETTQRARACFQSEDMRDEFGKSSAALLVPSSPPSPDPVPPAPRGINTIRGRKCGNPQQRAPSLNTNNQRAPKQYQKRPPLPNTLLCLSKWKSTTFILILPFCFQLHVIKEGNLMARWRCQIQNRVVWRFCNTLCKYIILLTRHTFDQYFSAGWGFPIGEGPERCLCTKKTHHAWRFNGTSLQGTKWLFSQSHNINPSSFILCCGSEKV